jgi:hypothetical protein
VNNAKRRRYTCGEKRNLEQAGVKVPLAKESNRSLKRKVLSILQSEAFGEGLENLFQHQPRRVVNPLFSFLLSGNEQTRWRAVTAMGAVVARLADGNMESARGIMRRLMWSLNDESGGIGWGAPGAMGEIIACHEGLAREYANVLISYIWKEGNYLEHEMLQRGALWGVGRAAQKRAPLLQDAVCHLIPFLSSSDAMLRGLAAWALGFLGPETARTQLEALAKDTTVIPIYLDGKIRQRAIKTLAAEALGACRQDCTSGNT